MFVLILFDFLLPISLPACLSVTYFHPALNFKEIKRKKCPTQKAKAENGNVVW
jgi:hypothetical protein